MDSHTAEILARLDDIALRLSRLEDAIFPKKIPNPADHRWELRESERMQGFVRPLRMQYIHSLCATTSHLDMKVASNIAKHPSYYSTLPCMLCGRDFLVDQFKWVDSTLVGS
jgi:hypothetical protein